MNLFRRKSVTDLQAEALTDQSLKRALRAVNLTALGVGEFLGTGIFVLTRTVGAQHVGRAVVLSFILAGVSSVFAAMLQRVRCPRSYGWQRIYLRLRYSG